MKLENEGNVVPGDVKRCEIGGLWIQTVIKVLIMFDVSI